VSQVFISYARSTEREARAIEEALRGLGYGVWRDDELPAHRAYADVIEERLSLAKAVLVIWSAEAAKSEWVRSEAERARAERKLVQLTLDGARLPMPFDQIQCAELAGWAGHADHPGWRKVIDSVAQLVGAPAVASPQTAPIGPRTQSICVLPFANISDDPQQEYFSDGISEDIITDLNKVSALFVVARNTAFSFKNKPVPISDVARELGVKHVLEGSVRKAGNRVRITAQLIDGQTGGQVWAERWDRTLDDIFALQDEISEAVVAALKVKLLPAEKKAIETRGTENVEAYNIYLMARRHYLNASARRFDFVVRLCQRAIDLDPNYARVWALKGLCKSAMLSTSSTSVEGDGWAEAEQALKLDPNLAEAHAAKARIHCDRGQFAEAQVEVDLALRLDPISVEVNRAAGVIAMMARRYADSIRHFETASADEQDSISLVLMMQCCLALDDIQGAQASARRAVERLEKAIVREPDNGEILAHGATALVTLGDAERAKDWARQALIIDPANGNLRYNLACAMTKLGEFDHALEYLGAAFDFSGPPLLHWVKEDNDMDPLRGDPRFQALIAAAEARMVAGAETAAD
jgi:adenylate cyclase